MQAAQETREQPVPPELAPGELAIRVAARGIDVLVVAGLDVGLGMLIGFGFDWLALAALIVLAYFVVFDALAGATPGKLAFGLRVLGPEGGRPSLRQASIRESFTLLGAIPFVGPLLAIAAWVWIARGIHSTPLRQGKHDELAGGTRVVRLRGAR
ncbi:RDD family protein [Nannocystaceae bacterium ST9]